MASCISTPEFIWHTILAFVVLWLGIVTFVAGAKGHIRFESLVKLKDHQRFAKVFGSFLCALGLLLMASTVFGWGC